MKLKMTIQFYSYWAVGTGKGGSSKDSMVMRDENGLPFIPGKTLKGLFRHAFCECSSSNSNNVETETTLFGHQKHSGEQEGENKVGILKFSSAYLPSHLQAALNERPELKAGIYETKMSTRLDDKKQAVDHSLRKNEVCIPLELEGSISSDRDLSPEELKKLKNAAAMLRYIGEKRHRGLGRCNVTLT